MIDWKRVKRTTIQSLVGVGVSILTLVSTNFSVSGIVQAVIQGACTVGMAVLMNIKSQIEGDE